MPELHPAPVLEPPVLASMVGIIRADDDEPTPRRYRPDELDALADAMMNASPACAGDDAFTADVILPSAAARMTARCAACPVRRPCAEYAAAAEPTAGFWAGTAYPVRRRAQRG